MRARRTPHGRLLTWVILAFNLGMLLWLVVALDAAGEGGGTCVGELCREASSPDSLTDAWLVIFFWPVGVVILGVAWFVTHGTERRHRGRHRRGP
jgi:H+/Cl- antiporter ClcA